MLFVGRLSEEKGILEFLEATEGLPRVIVGDGPLRDRVPRGGRLRPAGGGSARTTSGPRSSACRRGARATAWSAREAMAYGRPVVATRVGGLADAVEDGVNGVLVEPCDTTTLRAAVEGLLADSAARLRLGAAAHDSARADTCAVELVDVYGGLGSAS